MEIETGIVSLLKLQGGFWVWLSYELKKAWNIFFFFTTKIITGLIETHSYIMHLGQGDSVALSLAENTHDETCQAE